MWLDKLKAIKKEKNMTSKQIAEAARLSEQTVKNIFSGETEAPRIDTIRQIVAVLDTSLDELFAESGGVVATKAMTLLAEENRILKETISKMEDNYKILVDETKVAIEEAARLRKQNDELKDKVIAIHEYYMKKNN